MSTTIKFMLCAICLLQITCGVIVGTIVDTGTEIVSYPFREYVFWGSYKYDNTWEDPYQKIENKRDNGELLLGVAVSGGGSRSAYFFACVMDELSKIPVEAGSNKSYVDELDFISSVSGGSLASAYYVLNKENPKYKGKNQAFFRDFKRDMLTNFETAALLRILFYGGVLNFFTYHDRGDIMADVWDGKYFDSATFKDLRAAEDLGSPALIINGTNLNDGLKFVFSTVDDDRFNKSHFFADLKNAGGTKRYGVSSSHVPFKTVGFKAINSDIARYPVSKAVIASASVPNLLGPVTLKDYTKEDRLIHIIDGGVYDNYGVESLMQVFTEYLDRHPGQRAKIVIIDGSGFFRENNQHSDKFSVAYYSERPLSIAWLRAKHYMVYALSKAQVYMNKDGVKPYRNLSFELISLYDVLPSQETQETFSKDAVLQAVLRLDVAASDFLAKVTTIQTRFKVSDDDAKAIEKVAANATEKLKKGRP